MKHIILLICLILLFLPMITGCWNRHELNELAIVVGMGIDNVGKDYLVSIQIVIPGEVAVQKGGSNRTPVTTYHARGSTVLEAIRRMSTIMPRRAYYAHLRVLVIGEKLARQGLGDILDYIARDHEYRTDFNIIVAKGTEAYKILNILVPLEKLPAHNMFMKLDFSEKTFGTVVTYKLDELIRDIVSKGKEPVLSGIMIDGSYEIGITQKNVESVYSPAHVKYDGIAVFKKDKLLGWLNEEESKSYHYIKGKLKTTIEKMKCENKGNVTIELIQTSSKVKGRIENGKPVIEIAINTKDQCR